MMRSTGTFHVLRDGHLTVHSYLAPVDGDMVCSQVIETDNSVVVVDAQLLRAYAGELRAYVDRLHKKVDRVVITHSHPDHWLGLESFEDLPIHALAETKDEITSFGDYLVQYRRGQLGDLVADHKVVPSHVIEPGEETIDGVPFVFSRVVDAETSFMLTIELPKQGTLVAQDLVYNRVFLCVGEQNAQRQYLFDGWTQAIQAFQERRYDVVLPGHGEPTDSSVFAENIAYIREAQHLFESVSGEQELKRVLMERHPTYRVPELLDLSNVFLYHRTW